MKEYIDREAVVMGVLGLTIVDPMVAQYADAVLHQIQQAPAADVVSRAAFDQVMWERDVAIQQLREDYGVGLGEKKAADVVERKRGAWIWDGNAMDWGLGGWVCSECHAKNDNIPAKPDVFPSAWQGSHFCPNCGCQMVGDENGRS